VSISIASLNSGSNGNCYYIGNKNEAVLIDAGISCKETEKRLRSIGISVSKIKAIFISHEHIDHIKGAEILSKKYSLPVYITKRTKNNCSINVPENKIVYFNSHEEIQIGEIKIKAFPKYHDAIDPHSFVVEYNNFNVGVFTDIGIPCENIKKHFSNCHAAFLEANYDEAMLQNGHYPYHLKKRISGDDGHLSNAQALELFMKHRSPYLSHLLLSHLSKENNRPELAEKLFKENSAGTYISVASRYNHSELFCIGDDAYKKAAPLKPMQLNLFINPLH
jgi:phosphoribosyl 1,2-cyclic phosphodiesterase